MTHNNIKIRLQGGHRIIMMLVLCLFGLCLIASSLRLPAPKKPAKDDRVYLVHADELKYDAYGLNPMAQIRCISDTTEQTFGATARTSFRKIMP